MPDLAESKDTLDEVVDRVMTRLEALEAKFMDEARVLLMDTIRQLKTIQLSLR